MPIMHGPVRGHRGNAGVVRPDEAAAGGIGSRCIAFIELADVARRRLKAIS